MRNKLNALGIRARIIYVTALFTLFILVVIGIGSYIIYSSYLENQVIESTDTKLLFLSDYIDNELDNIDQLIQYCRTSSQITSFIERKDSSTQKIAAYEALNEYTSNNASSQYLHRVAITNLNNNYIQIVSATFSSTISIASDLPTQNFYPQMTDSDYSDYNVGFVTDPFYPRKRVPVIPVLKPVSYKFNSNLGGYIFIEVDEKLFSDAFANYASDDGGPLILTLGEHNYIYNKDGHFTPTNMEFDYAYQMVTEPLEKEGCYVSQIVPLSTIRSQWYKLFRIFAVIFIIIILLTLALNASLSTLINTPVDAIRRKLHLITDGDFARDTSIEWEHELGEIGRGVNDLAENISQLIDNKIEDEKQKKDLEYKVLQSQINPHFLYNTLNSIKWMAQIQGATGIVDMTTALARLLKSISKGTKLLIPLSEEIALVSDYFTIQKYRYGGTINMEINVDDDRLLDCQIIKFTLQPLVENAIFHGIEPTGSSGNITIHVYSKDDLLHIDVKDNGVGMDEETAAHILSDNTVNPSDFFKEIGVSNVHNRLQYEFGAEYGITIDSKLNEYTVMSICLPQRFEENLQE